MKIIVTIFIMLTVAGSISAQGKISAALASLADAERAFSAYTVKVGFRDGFIKYFADDGIGFGPHPERTKEVLSKTPAETGFRTLIFEWAPMFGDISAAGDLGYTTGPVLFTPQGANAKPPFHGIYFSVWQKQSDGTWKVAIDMGVDTPSAVAPINTGFVAAKTVIARTKSDKFEDYRKLDVRFSQALSTADPVNAYRGWLAEQFRVHRKGVMPITSLKDLAAVVGDRTTFHFIDGKIAASHDMAYTYGKYVSGSVTGYYVRVWRFDARGDWKLAVDVQNPLPKKAA